MICDNCKIERIDNDFINNELFCYHCMYRIKMQKALEKRTEKKLVCRCCGKEIVLKKNVKKRQRMIFCSSECAKLGHKEQLKNYWTRQVKVINICLWD